MNAVRNLGRYPLLIISFLAAIACMAISSLSLAATGSDAALFQRGAYLAKVGDCAACHTAPRGKALAGGLPMTTPLGTIYSTNISPDIETGIGGYSEQAFGNALRKGVAKDGHHLYPAMPYPSYTKTSDDDIKALYTYFMQGVTPVKQANKASDIPWPLNMRWPLALWNMVFLHEGRYENKPGQDALWNRGAYLVQSLGHCGACHTPRSFAFQEKALDERGKAFLSGAVLEGWSASNLAGDFNAGLGRWAEGDIVSFLKTGANAHTSTFGTMTTAVNNSTQAMTQADLSAIAHYLKTLPAVVEKNQAGYVFNSDSTLAKLKNPTENSGANLYQEYCIHCHSANGSGVVPYLAPLAGNPAVLDPDPSSLINVVLNGSPQLVIQGVAAPYNMPNYRLLLNDQQIAEVVSFVRAGWNNNVGAVNAKQVTEIRKLPVSAH